MARSRPMSQAISSLLNEFIIEELFIKAFYTITIEETHNQEMTKFTLKMPHAEVALVWRFNWMIFSITS